MIELFTDIETILISIGAIISNVASFFAGKRQRRINNFEKQQQIFHKQLDQFSEFMDKKYKDDRTKPNK